MQKWDKISVNRRKWMSNGWFWQMAFIWNFLYLYSSINMRLRKCPNKTFRNGNGDRYHPTCICRLKKHFEPLLTSTDGGFGALTMYRAMMPEIKEVITMWILLVYDEQSGKLSIARPTWKELTRLKAFRWVQFMAVPSEVCVLRMNGILISDSQFCRGETGCSS